MNSKQRVMAAANHQLPDRTPITFDGESGVYEMLHKHFNTEHKYQLWDSLNVDTWFVGPKHVADIPKKIDGQNNSAWGYRTTKVEYAAGGAYNELCFSPLAGKDQLVDIDNHRWPDPGDFSFTHCVDLAREQPGRAIIGHFTWGAYFIASFVRGMEDLLMDFAANQAYAERLINRIAEISLACLENLLDEAGDEIDIVYMADDYCSQQGPMFSPATFKKMVMPYLSKAADIIHKRDKKFLLHCCGSVRTLLPMIIDAGVDMLEPIQIRAAGMEPTALKKDFGKHLCFYGGMDLQQILCKATPQQVADETRRLIDILGNNGGYIFGPGHTYIQIDAPLENILAMYDTAVRV